MTDKEKIKRLIYLRKRLDECIDEMIIERVLPNGILTAEQIKESLEYVIKINLQAYQRKSASSNAVVESEYRE